MVKEKIKKIKENLAIKRFFITLFLTIAVSTFYFSLYKILEKPSLILVKKFEIANVFVWIDNEIKDSSYSYIEKTYEYKINYPYVIKRQSYCYDLPENGIYYNKNGNPINVEILESKVCLSSEVRDFIIKIIEKKNVKDFVVLKEIDNSYKIFIKNFFDFPINFEIRIDLEKMLNSKGNVYRDGILISSNTSYFFDSKVIAPYSNLEYELRRD